VRNRGAQAWFELVHELKSMNQIGGILRGMARLKIPIVRKLRLMEGAAFLPRAEASPVTWRLNGA
jgi:hypothetical protein